VKHHDPLAIENWQAVPNFKHTPDRHIRLKRFDDYKRRMARLLAKSIKQSEVSK
jgi:hypothetical protein